MRPKLLLPAPLTMAALTACTTPQPAPSSTPTMQPRAAAPADTAAELVGTWTITDVNDGAVNTLILSESGVWEVTHECGPVSGSWASLGDYFVATAWGGTTACTSGGDPRPTLPWVENTYRIARTESGWTLTDAAGSATASLTDGTQDGAPPQTTVVPLAQGFGVGAIEGRWVPLVDIPGNSFVEFNGERWESSDGCNGNSGKWADLGDGYFLSTPSGPQTAIGCENIPVETWVSSARTAGFDEGTLVLFDADGTELGRLAPARANE